MGDQERDFLFVVNGQGPAETAAPSSQRGKKRPHHKSRRGCLSCKRRRVKVSGGSSDAAAAAYLLGCYTQECDERSPCSNCLRRGEVCTHHSTKAKQEARKNDGPRSCTPQRTPSLLPLVDDTRVNLLHLELFYHFQRDIMGTLAFTEIWHQVLPWSFQEPDIMSTILCLAATHLSTLRPQAPHYSRVALQLLGKSASLLGEKLSTPVTARNIESLIATSLLMQYASWSHVEFLEEQELLQGQGQSSPSHGEHANSSSGSSSDLVMYLSQDPLLQLSCGVAGIFSEAFPILWGSDSVFLAASLYSPRRAIGEAILRCGGDPGRFIGHFMAIWDDPHLRCRPAQQPGEQAEAAARELSDPPSPAPFSSLNVFTEGRIPSAYICSSAGPHVVYTALKAMPRSDLDEPAPPLSQQPEKSPDPSPNPDPLREAFERIAERLSLLFSLIFMSTPSDLDLVYATTTGHPPPLQSLIHQLRPDIERFIFSFPVQYSAVFRRAALRREPRALLVLCHFYRAARILLTSPASWWARRRSRAVEALILRDLAAMGLDGRVLGGEQGDES